MRAALVVLVILGGLIVGSAKLTEDMEVVVLTTYQEGVAYNTQLWVLDDGFTVWIRAGGTDRRWYKRLLAQPNVGLERDGLMRGYTAEPDPDPRIVARVNHLMREKYGLADRIFSAIHTWSEVMPIRLLAPR
jgi:hypothetical protein